ncbi:hypothetical protein [Embleya sp. AB8]|uniref:hypothetical protein n=1 Tax=Embleya sp. AB8 TaxID=3156304 RepID=UPI003C772C9B
MKRLALTLIGAACLTAVNAAPTFAASPTTATDAVATTVSCGIPGIQVGLQTDVCVEITGGDVRIFGRIMATSPSPGGPPPQLKYLQTTLTGNIVGGPSLGLAQRNLRYTGAAEKVYSLDGTVPCGSVLHGTFTVSSAPDWSTTPVSINVPITC